MMKVIIFISSDCFEIYISHADHMKIGCSTIEFIPLPIKVKVQVSPDIPRFFGESKYVYNKSCVRRAKWCRATDISCL